MSVEFPVWVALYQSPEKNVSFDTEHHHSFDSTLARDQSLVQGLGFFSFIKTVLSFTEYIMDDVVYRCLYYFSKLHVLVRFAVFRCL